MATILHGALAQAHRVAVVLARRTGVFTLLQGDHHVELMRDEALGMAATLIADTYRRLGVEGATSATLAVRGLTDDVEAATAADCAAVAAHVAALPDLPLVDVWAALRLSHEDVHGAAEALQRRMAGGGGGADARRPHFLAACQRTADAIATYSGVDPHRARGRVEDRLDHAGLLVTAYDYLDLVHSLGRGGNASVFKARRLATGLTVAIKRLTTLQGTSADRKASELIAREADTWRRLSHTNVIHLLGVCLSAREPFMVMPLMAGAAALRCFAAHAQVRRPVGPGSVWPGVPARAEHRAWRRQGEQFPRRQLRRCLRHRLWRLAHDLRRQPQRRQL
jgi:hypothetical protein